MKHVTSERVEALVNRLLARNRPARAAELFGRWLEWQGDNTDEHEQPSVTQRWRYGRLLRDAGQHAKAAEVFRGVAALTGRKEAFPRFLVERSFGEWARCLDALGSHQSAEETRALGRRMAARWQREKDESGDELRSLSPRRLLRPVAARITFIMSLEWDGPPDDFELIEEEGFVVLRGRFRVSEPPGPWLEFQARTPSERDPSYPHVELCVRLPWCFADEQGRQSALALVNDMNADNEACSSCLEAASGAIAVRSRIGFAGYNDESAGSMNDFATAQEEATLNMFAEVLGTAKAWAPKVAELSGELRSAEPSQPNNDIPQ